MSYATLTELKTYLAVGGASDDGLLADLLDAATAYIDTYTRRHFAATSGSRTYYAESVDDDKLLLDDDLLTVTSIVNGNGATVTDYVLLPVNATPKRVIAITDPAGWVVDSYLLGITVAGQWGYSASPPEDIVHACVRLAAYYYRQKDAQVFDITAEPDAGVITVPRGVPADVKLILDAYRRWAYDDC